MTAGADRVLSRNIAILATAFSSAALLIAAFLGDTFLKKYDISIPILALTGGIILFLVALIAIIQQFQPVHAHNEINELPSLKMAMTPLAFPTIVTPYGIAILIVFLGLVPDSSRMTIFAMVFGIMLLDLVFMLVIRLINQRIFQLLVILLQILASVLGIIQVALGLKIIYKSLIVLLK
jgi:multiple antibiotic resistance protein